MDVEEDKGGEGVIGYSNFERVETILQDAYYSTFFSESQCEIETVLLMRCAQEVLTSPRAMVCNCPLRVFSRSLVFISKWSIYSAMWGQTFSCSCLRRLSSACEGAMSASKRREVVKAIQILMKLLIEFIQCDLRKSTFLSLSFLCGFMKGCDCMDCIQIIMSKRPFNKIRKIEKKENIEETQDNKQEFKIEQKGQGENGAKAPKLSIEKRRIKIGNNQPKNEEPQEGEQKNALGSKPNLFKGKREGGKLIINSNRNTTNTEQIPEDNYTEAPKPTPLVIKKRLNLEPRNKERENIIIQEEQPNPKNDVEESQSNLPDESNTFKRKPDLKIKRFLQKRQPSEKVNDYEESAVFNNSGNEPKMREETYIPVPVEYREISIQPSQASVSQGKLDKQRKRTNQLKNLLNLQVDLYEQTLTIGSVTPYEIYINKIKGGFLKNSNDQAFDDKTSNSCQTSSFQYNDFTNQCPQDYSVDISRIEKIDSSVMFDQFILRVAPVIEELMKPTDLVSQPPIFLLAFRPTFKAFLKCPYPIFVYRSEEFKLDLIVIGEKLYITEGEICSVLMIGKNIVAGLKNGYLVFWNGQNNKSSRLYEQIRELTQTTNFELPSYTTHQLQRFSSYSSEFSIVSLLRMEKSQFLSMDSTGKIVRWGIQQTNTSQEMRPLSVIELKSLTQHWALQAYSVKQRGDSIYISTSLGIICLHNHQIRQRLDSNGLRISTFQIPKKSPLVYAVTESNTLLIYNQLYSHHLFQMHLQVGAQSIKEIIIPQIQHQNRELLYLFVLYLIDTSGRIFELKLLQNKFQYVKQLGEESQSRKDKNTIFRGVSRTGETLQTVQLMRDLKITSSFNRMSIITDKSIPNLKSILQKNRELMTLLQHQSSMII